MRRAMETAGLAHEEYYFGEFHTVDVEIKKNTINTKIAGR